MFEQQCSVDVQVRNGVALVAVGGELDMATTSDLVDRLIHPERTDVGAILLDLRAVTFLDCSAIHAFLDAHDHARQNGHRFSLIGVNALAQRIMGLTGTQFLLHEDGMTEAMAQFTRPVSVDHLDPASEASS